MGLTLIAVLTAALLLPGIIAARCFYQAGRTAEVEPVIPSLSSPNGIALVGLFSVAVHILYVVVLEIARWSPWQTGLPPADPYAVIALPSAGAVTLDHLFLTFVGVGLLCALAIPVGMIVGRLVRVNTDRSIFYGPLTAMLATSRAGENDFIIAYVLSKIERDGSLVGYQGTVINLLRDEDRFPAKVILRDVSVFLLTFEGDRPVRREMAESIGWIALTAADWHNIAFQVFEVVDAEPSETAAPLM